MVLSTIKTLQKMVSYHQVCPEKASAELHSTITSTSPMDSIFTSQADHGSLPSTLCVHLPSSTIYTLDLPLLYKKHGKIPPK